MKIVLEKFKVWFLKRKLKSIQCKIRNLRIEVQYLFENELVGEHAYKQNYIYNLEQQINLIEKCLAEIKQT
jgi:hypothetical protein